MNTRTIQAAIVAAFLLAAVGAAKATEAPYKVVDGKKVDGNTLNGWRTWRGMACERCHGAQQEGLVGPSLVDSLKVLSKDDFKKTVLHGRMEKGMPNFDGSKQVVDNIDYLYAYLKGRSDGAIKPGRLEEISK
ncbi:MAG: cytochrome c [Oxalobacteraceae bacterium]|nr:cytochrome c [Oxalobacteraceae bacterium]